MFDLIVVGAGLSGLQAAYSAQQAGLSVAVIEARDRVGGKTWTVPLASGRGVADLGAAWINDRLQPRIWAYVQKFGLRTVRQRLEGKAIMQSSESERVVYPLRISGDYTDMTIICGDTEYQVHKAIVCPRSKYFDAMFSHGMQGTAIVLQGRYIEHQALKAFGGSERITMVTSFRAKSPFVKDESVLTGVRGISNVSDLYMQYTEYRLEILMDRIRAKRKSENYRAASKRPFDVDEIRVWLETQRQFIDAMLVEIYEVTDGEEDSSETNKDQNDLPRIISVNEVFKENASNEPVFDRTAVIAMRDDQVYYAAVLTRADKVDKQAIYSSLELVPPKKIYPAHEPELTRAPGLYIKTPQLSTYSPDSENVIASQTLNEAKIYEILRKNPHPALGTCLGCLVSDDGLVTGLELVRYEKTLFQRAHDPAFYEGDTRVKTMKTVKEARFGMVATHYWGWARFGWGWLIGT
ncbi:Putrescine oxidase like protein [Verticillium longisporum]|uniref:Putrescine oxidase like protein n=1 Tax=Verticillium longisporum TaxID=100787 RepID=A0A8I2Z5X2_VERLO|nr:Putrescine oxidase like protein [Verticillium longisporum]